MIPEQSYSNAQHRTGRHRNLVLVCHPHALRGPSRDAWQSTVEMLRRRATICGEVATASGDGNAERISEIVMRTCPEVVVAAGGDGTVRDAVQAIMLASAPTPPALAIFPLGTGNNVARAFRLLSVPQGGSRAADLAVAAIVDGEDRCIDIGEVNGGAGGSKVFVGSFSVGMDADILWMRNRLRRRLALAGHGGGYPLYLWCCAVSLARRHGARGRLTIDGLVEAGRIYNAVVTNTPLYAGEFRFDAADGCDDGLLDLRVFSGPAHYVCGLVAAWRRHVHHGRGRAVRPSRGLRRVRELSLELEAPAASQVDGEEYARASAYTVRVIPRALRIRIPPGHRGKNSPAESTKVG